MPALPKLFRRRHRTAATIIGSLRDREQLLSRLLSNLDGMVYRGRNDAHWTLDFVSEGCLALTGYSPQELRRNARVSYEALIHPDDRARVRRVIEASLAARCRYELEYRIQRAAGEWRWVWERGCGVCSASGEVEALEGIIQDITDRKHGEHALREAELRFRNIFENAIEGMFQSSPEAGYLTVNPALARLYGYDSPEQLIEQLRDIDQQLYVEPGRRTEFIRQMQTHGELTNFESQVYRRDGSVIWISENCRCVRDEYGELRYFEGTVEAITDRKQHDAEIRYRATHDSLTGLPNRALLHEMLQQATAGVERGGAEFAVVFIDIDQFKFINDSLGHAAGDELLLVMTQRLLSCVRAGDMVARQGGDEFVIVLAAPVSAAEAQRIGGRILASVAQPCAIAGRDISVSCSIGVTLCPTDSRAVGDLLRNADAAMYRAKELGRNNVQFFAADMNQRLTDRLALLTHLHRAVERGEFGLVYEPKYDLATLEIIGVEALIRWHTPEGTISPVDFIPLAEETGLILPIGEWVLRAACEQNRRWRDAGLPPVPVAVNLSRRQLAHGDIATQVAVLLDAIGLPPDGLELEVTESMVMQDAEKSVAMLRRLHAMGVQIAMDDFGTGYSNLSNLKRFPLHCLKIDKSFVQDVGADPDAAAITKAIISLAHILGLRTVAEGVETVEQLEFLRENRCDETQGYYFTRPVTAEAFARLLQQQGFRPALTGS